MSDIQDTLSALGDGLPEPSNHKIRPIDLKPGMFVIVSKWLDEPESGPKTKTIDSWLGPREVDVPRKPVGDPVKVLAIALPYITVDVVQHKQRGVLDTRVMELIKVNLSYVRSLVPDYGKRPKKLTDDEKRAQDTTTIQLFKPSEAIWTDITRPRK